MSSLIGKIVEHDGKIYQILSDRANLLYAHSYGDNCGIKETVLISKENLKIVATSSVVERQKCTKSK